MSEPRRPRGGNGGGQEALLREILANQAASAQRVTDLGERLAQTQEDAREARDLAKGIQATLREQDVSARMVELRKDVRDEIAALRQDMVHAITGARTDATGQIAELRTDVEGLELRLAVLEADKLKRTGARTLLEWALQYTPWLLAGLAAFAAGLFGRNDISIP